MSDVDVATLEPPAALVSPPARPAPAVIYSTLIVLAVILFILELTIGVVPIPVSALLDILSGTVPERASWTRIVLDFRLPRAWAAALAGSMVTSGHRILAPGDLHTAGCGRVSRRLCHGEAAEHVAAR